MDASMTDCSVKSDFDRLLDGIDEKHFLYIFQPTLDNLHYHRLTYLKPTLT